MYNIYGIPPFKRPRGLTFCKKSAKRLYYFVHFCLEKNNFWGLKGGGAFMRGGGRKIRGLRYALFRYE